MSGDRWCVVGREEHQTGGQVRLTSILSVVQLPRSWIDFLREDCLHKCLPTKSRFPVPVVLGDRGSRFATGADDPEVIVMRLDQ